MAAACLVNQAMFFVVAELITTSFLAFIMTFALLFPPTTQYNLNCNLFTTFSLPLLICAFMNFHVSLLTASHSIFAIARLSFQIP